MRLLRHFLPLSLFILFFLAPLLALAVPTGFNSDAQNEYYSYDYDDISPPDYDHVSLHSFCLVLEQSMLLMRMGEEYRYLNVKNEKILFVT